MWCVRYQMIISTVTYQAGTEQRQKYSSTLSLTSALDRVGCLVPRLGRSTTGKETRYPLYRWLSEPRGRSGRVRKILSPPGFDPPTVQPLVSRYTDCAVSAALR
jgi:hypothetical protein